MAGALYETTLSTLLRKSGLVLDEVDRRDVVLHRRDGEDVMLVRADRENDVRESLAVLSKLLAKLPDASVGQLSNDLLGDFPWMRFLPADDRAGFFRDLIDTARGCAELDVVSPLARCIREWKNTALVLAEPSIREAIHAPHDIDEAVPRPE